MMQNDHELTQSERDQLLVALCASVAVQMKNSWGKGTRETGDALMEFAKSAGDKIGLEIKELRA